VDASVVVVNWRRPDLTAACLRSLLAQRTERSYEIVLVENEAEEGAVRRWHEEFPSVAVVEVAHNAGFAGGVTRGLRASGGEVVVLVNNDATVDEGFLEAGLACLERGGADLAGVAARVQLEGRFVRVEGGPSDEDAVGIDGTRWRRVTGVGVELVNGTGTLLTRDGNGQDRDWLRPVAELEEHADDPFGFSGGAAFVRRHHLEAVGGFDETIFMYYEDLDLCWRLRLAGDRIGYAGEALVVHRHGGSSSSSSVLVREQSMRNRLVVVAANGSRRMIVRVVGRTAGRFVRDALRPARAHLPLSAWRRIARWLPRALLASTRRRRASGVSERERRTLEAAFLSR